MNKGGRLFCFFSALLIGLASVISANAASNAVYRLGVVRDTSCSYFDGIPKNLAKELASLGANQAPVEMVDCPNLTAAFSDPSVAMVLVLGDQGQRPVNNASYPKPLVMALFDLLGSYQVPATVTNFSYVAIAYRPDRDILVFSELVPLTHLGVVLNPSQRTPAVEEYFVNAAKKVGAQVSFLPDNWSAMTNLDVNLDAIYLADVYCADEKKRVGLIDFFTAKRLPVFSIYGDRDVQLGALAGLNKDFSERLVKRLALNIRQIMSGISPEDLRGVLPIEEKLLINAQTAAAVSYAPPLEVMINADFINEDALALGKELTIDEAMRIAVENNALLAARKDDTKIAKQNRNLALGNLLPQVDGYVAYDQLNSSYASATMQPENDSRIGLKASQMIFNDPLISQYRANSQLYKGSLDDWEGTRLDTMTTAALFYLRLLQSKALLKIDVDNLNLTRSNLELAKARQRAGVAGPEEVYRWENQAASQKATVIKSAANYDVARVALNQVLGVDINRQWRPVDIQVGDKGYNFLEGRINDCLENQAAIEKFQEFLVQFALSHDPVIQALGKKIAAQKMVLGQYRRRFVLPQVNVGYNYDHFLSSTYADSSLSLASDEDQSRIGVQAVLPLCQGGNRFFNIFKAEAELDQLEKTRLHTTQAAEQRVRSVCYSIDSSYPNIQLQRSAFDYAQKNMQVVKDKYARGAVSVIDLLDAQNQTFIAQHNVALAVYGFLGDIITMQRSISWFEMEHNDAEKQSWIQDLKKYQRGEKSGN